MNFSKDLFLKLAGSATVLGLVIVLQPLPVKAAALALFTPDPCEFAVNSSMCEEQLQMQQECEAKTNATQTATWNSTTDGCNIQLILCPNQYYRGIDGNCYPEGSITESAAVATTTTATTTILATTTTATDKQSEIVKLLQQLIALETQLVQLQSGQI